MTNKQAESYFDKNTKLADVILQNYKVLNLLPRFSIRLGIGDKNIGEICMRYGVDLNLFLLVCNVSTFDEYLPHAEDLLKIDVDRLIDYLQRSHSYYLVEKIAYIENHLAKLGSDSDQNTAHYQVLSTFFSEYKNEIIKHFEYEEQIVFPYIVALKRGDSNIDYHINQFEENHGNIEDKLSDLKNIIIKYLPDNYSLGERNNILFELFLLEEDLMKHNLIEDKVLVPLVEQIEQLYDKK